jgi:hypothetical protein
MVTCKVSIGVCVCMYTLGTSFLLIITGCQTADGAASLIGVGEVTCPTLVERARRSRMG